MNSKVIEFEEKFSSKYIVSLHDASREDKKKIHQTILLQKTSI